MKVQSSTEKTILEDISTVKNPYFRCTVRKLIQSLWMALFDLVALSLSGILAIPARFFLLGRILYGEYTLILAVVIFVLILIFAFWGLYPGIGVSPPDEIKKLTAATSGGLALISIILFVFQRGAQYSRAVFLLFWAFALFLVPLMRLLARRIGFVLRVWREPAAIIGQGKSLMQFHKHLRDHRLYGFEPVILIDFDAPSEIESNSKDIPPVIPGDVLIKQKEILSEMGINTAFILQDGLSKNFQEMLLYEEVFKLRHLIVISELGYIGGSAIMPYDLQGVLGLKVQRNLFMRRYQLIKRVINILATIVAIPIVLPLFLLFGILIRLDSHGKILYAQTRLGYQGKPFKMLKFRTMVNNGDAVLEVHLANYPEAKLEWEQTHKLKDDPRVTRIGRFLRQTSLDELPQLWNVLRGEMSLVGPRPIVAEEIKYYGQSYETYKKVKPGMTGLWQVSGRNDTSYENRVLLDEYYVRHWSIWLDFYILMRTLWAVFARKGAY